MSVIDSVLNMVSRQPKDPDAPKPPAGSRSEREAKIKDKYLSLNSRELRKKILIKYLKICSKSNKIIEVNIFYINDS